MADEPQRRGGCRRWLVRGFVVLAALALAVRIALPVALPFAIERIAAGYGLEAELDDADFVVLGGYASLRGLELRPEDAPADADPLLQASSLVVDVDVSALLTGTLRVHRVELDELELWVERDEAGVWNYERHLPAPAEEQLEEETEEDRPEDEPKAQHFGLPFELRNARVEHVVLHVEDRATQPPLVHDVAAYVRVERLGDPEGDTELELLVSGTPLDRLHVAGTGRTGAPELTLDLDLDVRGLRIGELGPWLGVLGWEPLAEHLDADLALSTALRPSGVDHTDAAASLKVEGVRLTADGDPALELALVDVQAPSIVGATREVGSVLVEGLRVNARTLADGRTAAAGLAFGAAPPRSADADAADAPAPVAATTDAPERSTEPTALRVTSIALRDFAFGFEDESCSPAVDLGVRLVEAELGDLVFGPASATPPLPSPIRVTLESPGVFERLDLVGTGLVHGDERDVDLVLELEGLAPSALEGWLARAGVRSEWEDGRLSAHLEAQTRPLTGGGLGIEASLTDLALVDGEPVLELAGATVRGLAVSDAGTRIEDVDVFGLATEVARDEQGTWRALRFALDAAEGTSRTSASEPPAEPTTSPTNRSVEPADGTGGRFELTSLRWRDSELAVTDAFEAEAPRRFTLEPREVFVEDLFLGGGEPGSGRFGLWLDVPQVAERIGLGGALDVGADGSFGMTADLGAETLGLAELEAYLSPLGMTPLLVDGQVGGRLELAVASNMGATEVAARLVDVSLEQGERTWLAIGELSLDDAAFGAGGNHIGEVALRDARLEATRKADGSLELLGLRLGEAPAHAESEQTDMPPPAFEAPPDAETPRTQAPPAPPFRLDALRVDGLALDWRDETLESPVEERLVLTTRLDAFVQPDPEEPARFEIALRDSADRPWLDLTGNVSLGTQELALDADLRSIVEADSPLLAYLPPSLELREERLAATGRAELSTRSVGGTFEELRAAALLDVADGAGVVELGLDAPRIGAGAATEIARLELSARVEAGWDTDGTPYASGLAFPAQPVEDVEAGADEEPATDTLEEATVGPDRPLDRLRARRQASPGLRIDALRLEVAARVTDRRAEGTEPLDVRVELSNPAPLVLVAEDEAEPSPLELVIDGEARPLVDEVGGRVSGTVGDDRSTVEASLALTGIRGTALPRFSPELASAIDASAYVDGTFDAALSAELEPVSAGGRSLELDMGPIALRGAPDGPVLAGLDELYVRAPRLDPAGGLVHFETIALDTMRGEARSMPEGSGFAGLLFRTPEPQPEDTVPAPEPDEEAAPEPDEPGEVAAPESEAPPPPYELRVDELALSGIDFRFVDETSEAPLILPLVGLEVLVANFSTRALREPLPVSFYALVEAGQVPLPERIEASSVVAGFLGAAAQAMVGEDDDRELVDRKLFEEIVLSGRTTLDAKPQGNVSLDVIGFELLGVRGPAGAGGVQIGDGVLDLALRAKLRGEEGMRLDVRPTFGNLSMSEPENGPISKFLKLPAPLDSVIFLLKDASGEIATPIEFGISEKGVSATEIGTQAGLALGKVIATAVASSPLRVGGAVTGLLGLGGEETGEVVVIEAVEIPFAPGLGRLGPEGEATLADLARRLAGDEALRASVEHVQSPTDWQRAGTLANPSPEQASVLAASLRTDRTALLDERARLVRDARTGFLIGDRDQARALGESIAALDLELAELDAALTETLALLRTGAERRAERRTRATMAAIAAARLEVVEAALRTAVGDPESARVVVRRARVAPPVEGEEPTPETGGVRVTLRRSG